MSCSLYRVGSSPDIHAKISSLVTTSACSPSISPPKDGGGTRYLTEQKEEQTRHSIRSIDSGLGVDDPTQVALIKALDHCGVVLFSLLHATGYSFFPASLGFVSTSTTCQHTSCIETQTPQRRFQLIKR